MLHFGIPKLTLTIISVAQRRNGGGPSGVFPGTGQDPPGTSQNPSELTELTSRGMLSPPRYDVMTLRTGCDYDLGSGFPPDETIPDDRRVQLRGMFLVVGDVSV